MRLAVEVALARAAGRLSRLSGRGGGTTLPGKLLAAVDPGAITALASRLPQGSVVISATNGKTTTAALAASILSQRATLARNAAGANLVSGVASTLATADRAELGLFEVDEAALPEVARRLSPRVVALGNLFRDQLDRYGELELVAERWRTMVGQLPDEAWLVVDADDPVVADLACGRERVVTYGVDDPAQARPSLQHAADSKYCLRCGAPYAYRAAYVGHLGDYVCPACGHERPELDVYARDVVLNGVDSVSFELVVAGAARHVGLRLPGLYNVYNALAAAAVARALDVGVDDVARGLERTAAAFGRAERIAVGDRTLLLLLIKNPAGANEVVRTLVDAGPRRAVLVALNDATADGRDVSWIWDVDFEPLTAAAEHLVVSGGRAAELALRFKYGGCDLGALEVVPDLERALDRALELVPPGGELVCLPTYTAMLALQRVVTGRGLAKPYWERVA